MIKTQLAKLHDPKCLTRMIKKWCLKILSYNHTNSLKYNFFWLDIIKFHNFVDKSLILRRLLDLWICTRPQGKFQTTPLLIWAFFALSANPTFRGLRVGLCTQVWLYPSLDYLNFYPLRGKQCHPRTSTDACLEFFDADRGIYSFYCHKLRFLSDKMITNFSIVWFHT